MLSSDQKAAIINTFHSLSMLNFAPVLDHVSQSEFLVMTVVEKLSTYGDNDAGRVSSIAQMLHVSSPAISRTLTSLEHKGYAARMVGVDNRRNTGVRLTDEGKRVFMNECENVNRVFEQVAASMGEEKITQLVSLANEMTYSFSKALKNKA